MMCLKKLFDRLIFFFLVLLVFSTFDTVASEVIEKYTCGIQYVHMHC